MQTKKILIIKLGAAGDVLRTTCLLKPLKVKYPQSKIFWVTSRANIPLLQNNHWLDAVYALEEYKPPKETFDLVISLDEEEAACRLASRLSCQRLTGAYFDQNDQKKYTTSARGWFGMGLLRPPRLGGKAKADLLKKLNTKTYQWHMFKLSGLDPEKSSQNNLLLNLKPEELNFAAEFRMQNKIKKKDLVIGLATGAAPRWQWKSWLVENTTKLAEKLSKELKAKVVLLGGPNEEKRNAQIRKSSQVKILNPQIKSLRKLSALINQCDLVITSDSLALHVALALKKKVVVLFGPTSSQEIELYGLGKKIIPHIDCVCCYKQRCARKPNCMESISVATVYQAVQEVLK